MIEPVRAAEYAPACTADEAAEAESGASGPSAELQQRAKSAAASMMFVELLFWTPARLAEVVRDEYNWQVQGQSQHAWPLNAQG